MGRITDSGPKQLSGKIGNTGLHCRTEAPHGTAQQDKHESLRTTGMSFAKQYGGHNRINGNGNHICPKAQRVVHNITEIYILVCTKVHYIVFREQIQ